MLPSNSSTEALIGEHDIAKMRRTFRHHKLSQFSTCGGTAIICHAEASDKRFCSDTTHYSEVHEFHLYTGACNQYIFAHTFLQAGRCCMAMTALQMLTCSIKTAGREILNQRLCCMHPNIIQFQEVFLTPDHLAIVSEYAPGGDLVDFIERHNTAHDRALMESEARRLFQQLIVGVDFCHQVTCSAVKLIHMQVCTW